MQDDAPLDPFAGDPSDPARDWQPEWDADHDDGDEEPEPLTPEDREEILSDLEDLEVFRALLEPRAVRGLVVDCDDCREPHYFSWDLLAGNLRHLLDAGQTRVHEPAFSPDPADYVSWDSARGFADGVLDADDEPVDPSPDRPQGGRSSG
jgi:hypothetical protein